MHADSIGRGAGGAIGAGPGGGGPAAKNDALVAQLRQFAQQTQMELEKKLQVGIGLMAGWGAWVVGEEPANTTCECTGTVVQ